MTILIASLLTILNALWLALIVIGLPGTWLMAATTLLVAWWRWDHALPADQQMFGVPVLVAVVALAVLGEVLEFFAGVAGAKRAGGSGWGSLGALGGGLIGGIAGTIFIPIPLVGSLAGACLGAAGGAWMMELSVGRDHDAAMRSGVGAGVGRFTGTMLKLAVAVAMWLTITLAAFWP